MKKSKIVGTIISAIIIVVGVFALVYNAVIVYNSDLKYLFYKSTEGYISSIQASSYDDNDYYRATYTFNVDGVNYSCNSGFTDDENKYSTGEKDIVRYDSKNPSRCALISDDRTINYLYLGISCILLIIGIKFFVKQIG